FRDSFARSQSGTWPPYTAPGTDRVPIAGEAVVIPTESLVHVGPEGRMGSKYRQHPSFCWSNTRHDAFESCERKYFYQYYGSHLGWATDVTVSKEQRVAYRLKQLTSLHATLGSAVHTLCQER